MPVPGQDRIRRSAGVRSDQKRQSGWTLSVRRSHPPPFSQLLAAPFFNRSSEYSADDCRDVFYERVQKRTQTILAQPMEKLIDSETEQELERILNLFSKQ